MGRSNVKCKTANLKLAIPMNRDPDKSGLFLFVVTWPFYIGRFTFYIALFLLLSCFAFGGCQARPSTAQMLTSSAGPERMRAVLRLAKQNRWSNVPVFIDFLEDKDVSVRMAAIGALTDQVGTDMDFRSTDPSEERAAAVERWKKWLGEQSNVKCKTANVKRPM